jgi:hypothetical protein
VGNTSLELQVHLSLATISALCNSKNVVFETHLGTVDLTYYIVAGLLVFAKAWGWLNFVRLEKFKDLLGVYFVESNYIVKADITIVGSSNDG